MTDPGGAPAAPDLPGDAPRVDPVPSPAADAPVAPVGIDPAGMLEALRAGAGSPVDGAAAGSTDGVPDVSGLAPARAGAVLSAWTGARLHAGQAGLLRAEDPDLALLVGDWSYAHALQALAHAGDLEAIGRLAGAIGDCAVLLTERPGATGAFAEIWRATCASLQAP